ncbi:MAG: ATP-dependent sacrificial sulfur transferase LarE [Planctomycetota bacterium]|nr:ATP-dependent sacrificial sulfur transferase LarE [Planctomycetota bacterium]
MDTSTAKAENLLTKVAAYDRCLVAFSGGVDSAVVAAAALRALGPENCLAVTGLSASVAQFELETAKSVAKQIGIKHEWVETNELDHPGYVANQGDRCFHCKTELYDQLRTFNEKWVGTDLVILNGTNSDDQSDYRPGLVAATNGGVKSPLAELGYGKEDVRRIAKLWSLPVWNKPASPCLSSRLAYGETVTEEKLSMIEKAESYLRTLGFLEFRVRYHPGKLARIEVDPTEINKVIQEELRTKIIEKFKLIGFHFTTVDAEGFRSGNLNQSLMTHQIGSS